MADQTVIVTEDNLAEFATKLSEIGLGGGSDLLEEFFEVTEDNSEEIITDTEIINEIQTQWNTAFGIE